MAFKPIKSQTISISGTHQECQDVALLASTIVRIYSTSDCYLEIGSSPVATNSSMFLPAGVIEYFNYALGQKVSVVSDGNSGTLMMTEGN